MAASDPTTNVPTPAGTLQGVAAFSWDGAVWQPSGRAGPAVATPTGALQGVAPFSWSGSAWTPTGRAQPGVATPSGVLDGVAVYTWSGSAWTPAGGTATPSTPSGALRGVAAFAWDGAAWQPAGQAGPSVPTPYGVLAGVAFFNWSGTAWAAGSAAVPSGAALDLSFLSGTLDPRITFTRASTATYFDASGAMQTAATNAPRFDYDPVTHALRGLLIEDTRTNVLFPSGNLSVAPWTPAATGAVPVVTGNNTTAPDGTLTAARIVMPAVPAGANASFVGYAPAAGAVLTAFSIWLRGAVGGEIVNLCATSFTAYAHTTAILTTAWQRFSFTATPTAGGWTFFVGTDMRDATQTPTAAQTFYAWGAQSEAGAYATSYIPTTAAAVTRAQDVCGIPSANMGWFTNTGSWFAEFILIDPAPANDRILGAAVSASSGAGPFLASTSPFNLGEYDGASFFATANAIVSNAVQKGAMSHTGPVSPARICLNGGAIAGPTVITNGFNSLSTSGIRFLNTVVPGPSDDNGNGYIRRVRFWPRVLTDAEMQSVTT